MNSNLVRLDYQGIAVSFNEEGWFNATHAAAHHGKRVADWLETHDTQAYLAALAELLKVPKKALLKANRGRYGGTWMHPKLAVPFARWLDVRFAIWCDIQIDELLKGQHPHYDWKRLRHEASSSFKVMNDLLAAVRAEQGKSTVAHHFSNEARLINWALSGEFKGIDRNALPSHDLDLLAKLELKNAALIGRGVGYADRKKILESTVLELRLLLSSPPLSISARTPPQQEAA